jgi:hypothetical protein
MNEYEADIAYDNLRADGYFGLFEKLICEQQEEKKVQKGDK